jgi:hypothetical protein
MFKTLQIFKDRTRTATAKTEQSLLQNELNEAQHQRDNYWVTNGECSIPDGVIGIFY